MASTRLRPDHPEIRRIVEILELDGHRHQHWTGARPLVWQYVRTITASNGVLTHEFRHPHHPVTGSPWRVWVESIATTKEKA